MKRLFALVALAAFAVWPLVFAGPGPVILARYTGGPVTNGGSIKGVVTIDPVPSPAEFLIGKDSQTCASAKINPRLVVDASTKGVGNVVVFIDGIENGKPRPTGVQAVINQSHCQYSPHITIAPVKSRVVFSSGDPILHNVHVYKGTLDEPHSKTKDVLNAAMKDDKVAAIPLGKRVMRKPGFYYVRCDAGHIWMSAYVWVVEHPYYVVTDKKGAFTLSDVPAGTYKLRFWHENWVAKPIEAGGKVSGYAYGPPIQHTAQVTVKPGEAVTVNWKMAG